MVRVRDIIITALLGISVPLDLKLSKSTGQKGAKTLKTTRESIYSLYQKINNLVQLI